MQRMRRILVLAAVAVLAMVGTASAQTALSADDVAEINQLYAQYNLALDRGDAQAWADTFTPDGVFGNSEGRDALVEFAEGFHKQQAGNARHWNTNTRVTATADGAAGTTYLQLWNVGARPHSIIVTGIYHDTLVETADGWRFKSRRVEVDQPADGGQ